MFRQAHFGGAEFGVIPPFEDVGVMELRVSWSQSCNVKPCPGAGSSGVSPIPQHLRSRRVGSNIQEVV